MPTIWSFGIEIDDTLEDVKWFEKYDKTHQKDEEWNPIGGEKFDDSKDNIKSVNKYLDIGKEDLYPDYSGIRPKPFGKGEKSKDFIMNKSISFRRS